MSVQDLSFGHAERAENPSNGRKETAQRRRRRVNRNLTAVRERASVVDGGVGRLVLENGEERESDEGQTYVYGRRSQNTARVHLRRENKRRK